MCKIKEYHWLTGVNTPAGGSKTGGGGHDRTGASSAGTGGGRRIPRVAVGNHAVSQVPGGGLLLCASAEPVLAGAGRAVGRGDARGHAGAPGVRPAASHRPVGRAARLFHRRGGRRLHPAAGDKRSAPGTGSGGHPRDFHHRHKGGGALPPLLPAGYGAAGHPAALHQPGQLPRHAGRSDAGTYRAILAYI